MCNATLHQSSAATIGAAITVIVPEVAPAPVASVAVMVVVAPTCVLAWNHPVTLLIVPAVALVAVHA